jgi:hypothetical protein
MFMFIFFLFFASVWASDDPCKEYEGNEREYAACMVREAIALAREADAKRIEAERALEAERAKHEESIPSSVSTVGADGRPPVPDRSSAPTSSPRVIKTTISPRGVQSAALIGRPISTGLAPTQVCVYNLSHGVTTHLGQSVPPSSVRIVAVSADGLPVVPNAGMSIMTYPTLADLEGNGHYQMVTAFSPNADEICLPAQRGQAVTLLYLRDTGFNHRELVDEDDDGTIDRLQEVPMYGGPNTGSMAVTYENTTYGVRKTPASGGNRGNRQ